MGCLKAPPGSFGRGLGRRGDGLVGVVTAWLVGAGFGDRDAGCFLIDEGFVAGECCGQRVQGEVVDGSGVAARRVVDDGDRVSGEQGVAAAGDLQVVGDVVAGLLVAHPGQGVSHGDALVERGEHAQPEALPQGGLTDQEGSERRTGVHVVVREHPDRFELGIVQQVGLVEDDHGGTSAFGVFGGQRISGLRGQGRGVERGDVSERGDDVVQHAAHPDRGVG